MSGPRGHDRDHVLTGPAADRGAAVPVALRPEPAHVEEHAAEPVAVPGIAAAAHVTVRARPYAFRHPLGINPLSRLRETRLGHAQEKLRAADPRG
ncbi:hypothetical protein ACIPPJ_08400 [Streptomyces sp. NPDC086091]|uniref:hypothetical protein n=1 Tax=Streptomyces sp. NPDC086091 TaxID=3365751 RepID=UPI003823C1F5